MSRTLDTHIMGFAPPDETWQRMKAVWDACAVANVMVPAEVEEFFGGEAPDPAGTTVELPVREWSGDGEAGYELDVAAIPPQVKTIRFSNSW